MEIDRHVLMLGDLGREPIITSYIIIGEGGVIIPDPGPSSVYEELLEVAWPYLKGEIYVIASHPHIDHWGSAWRLLEDRGARIIAYESGLKHFIDPSRLLSSSKEVMGEIFDDMGEVKPIPRERLIGVRDGESLEILGRRLSFHRSPGHAPHHMVTIYEGIAFTGDTFGIYHRDLDILVPQGFLPIFDLEMCLESMKMVGRISRILALPHFGVVRDVKGFVDLNLREYRFWEALVREEIDKGSGEGEIIDRLMGERGEYERLKAYKIKYRYFVMSVQGFMGYVKGATRTR